MDVSLPQTPHLPPSEPPAILPDQLWNLLSPAQQHHLRQILLRISHQLVMAKAHSPPKETSHE